MEVVFGFGPHHEEQTRALVGRMADEILSRPAESPEAVAKGFMDALGTFKDKTWRIGTIRSVSVIQRWEGALVITVEGQHAHYRDDHPMSPDGYASIGFPFCLTIFTDDVWKPRAYIALYGERKEQP